MVPAVLRLLAEQLRLEGEDVVENPVHAPALQPVVGDDARVLELATEHRPERSVDPTLTSDLRLFEQLQAAVQSELLRPVRGHVHAVPRTSTRPCSVTRACTLLRDARP